MGAGGTHPIARKVFKCYNILTSTAALLHQILNVFLKSTTDGGLFTEEEWLNYETNGIKKFIQVNR